jgi:hypothetical protein
MIFVYFSIEKYKLPWSYLASFLPTNFLYTH